MVVFTCNNCGESLQKPKVAKHYQFQCRTSENLTCVDCHKDFYGQEYVAHTKCITESERYGGQDYVARPGQNKGEKKQQEWINVVKNVIETAKNLSKEERNVLNILSKHENIPRKKAKFLNFIRSVMSNRFNMAVIDSVWSKMETAFKDAVEDNKPAKENKNGVAKEEEEKLINETTLKENQENNIAENQNNENICKENGNTVENGTTIGDKSTEKKKKSKKRELTEAKTNSVDEPPTKKNKKKTDAEIVDIELTPVTQEDENKKKKFDWKAAILEIVGKHDEITMKKLRKKVCNRYVSECSNSVTFEKACSRFDKKLGKITEVTVDENKVRLSR